MLHMRINEELQLGWVSPASRESDIAGLGVLFKSVVLYEAVSSWVITS